MPLVIQEDHTIRFTLNRAALDRKLMRVLSVVLLFLYIYAPTFLFLPVNIGYVVIICAFLYFVMGTNLDKLRILFQSKIFLTFLYFYFFSLLYILLVPLFTQSDGFKTYFIVYVRLLIDIVLVIPFFVFIYKDELHFSLDKLLHDLVIIATIQGIIATIMLVVPGLKTFVFSHLVKLPSDKLLSMPYRGFGISYDFFYSMPLFQSLALVLTTKFLFERGKCYLLCYPFILISMVINARVSLLMIPIFAMVFLIVSLQSNDMGMLKGMAQVGLVFLALIVLIGLYFVINSEDLQIVIWSFGGIYDAVMALFGHGQSITLNRMIIEHIHFPHTADHLLFGAGMNIFGNPKSPVRSDLGYIRYIYFGGLLFSILVYFSFFNLYRATLKMVSNIHLRIFLISAGLMLAVAHFKGDAISSSAFMKGLLIIPIYLFYDKQKKLTVS